MTPEEAASRRRHPTAGNRRESPALRAVHSDTHSGGQESSRATEKTAADVAPARPSLLAIAAVGEAAGGVVATVWTGDLRILTTALAVFAVLAVVGARLERRPR